MRITNNFLSAAKIRVLTFDPIVSIVGFMDHVIELTDATKETVIALVHVERDGRITKTLPTAAGYAHVHKWTVKRRAETVVRQLSPQDQAVARIALTFGGYCYGTKSSVPGLKASPKGIRG